MGWTSSASKNDCVLTAISNLTGIPYSEVETGRALVNGRSAAGATYTHSIAPILDLLGWRIASETKGVRPAINYPCLFRCANGPRSKMGHLVAVVGGICYETDGTSWNPQARKVWQMTCYYVVRKG